MNAGGVYVKSKTTINSSGEYVNIGFLNCDGKDILVVGFDATDDAIASILDGKMGATIAQQPDLIGATAVKTAIRLINGETVEKTIPVEVTLITAENAGNTGNTDTACACGESCECPDGCCCKK
ncbi:MAG: substrate-binding domain-containing protein [Oscillospiraceae bacterium]|nr:substrate-binding domain-containing protein [Oscillospiraceae bacterium]MBR4101356.1 substrate-binding domain-containing protein [Oscillospiraceae bacterium]